MTGARISIATLRAATAPQEIVIAGVSLTADASGVLFLDSERLLIVADLHLEKGSSYARRRVLLPPFDTAATLGHLARAIARYNPARVIALGDSFHDRAAAERMGDQDRASLRALQAGRDWIWIAGNHDPLPPAALGGTAQDEIRIGALTFRHEPRAGACYGEIAGHLHPVARVVTASGSLRRRCFASDGERCIMPAFGAYAGGLNLRDVAFAPLFPARAPQAHVLGRQRVYAIAHAQCHAD